MYVRTTCTVSILLPFFLTTYILLQIILCLDTELYSLSKIYLLLLLLLLILLLIILSHPSSLPSTVYAACIMFPTEAYTAQVICQSRICCNGLYLILIFVYVILNMPQEAFVFRIWICSLRIY